MNTKLSSLSCVLALERANSPCQFNHSSTKRGESLIEHARAVFLHLNGQIHTKLLKDPSW